MTRHVLSPHSMVAHVWAQPVRDRQADGTSPNRNYYFIGRILYSYGRHFVVGWRGDNVTLLNSSNYSISTSRHKNYAWSAAQGRTVHIHDLTEVAHYLDDIEGANCGGTYDNYGTKNEKIVPANVRARRKVREFLQSTWADQSTEAREFLAEFAGFTRSLPKMEREHIRKMEREKLETERAKKRELKGDVSRLIRITDSEVSERIQEQIAEGLRFGDTYDGRERADDRLLQLGRRALAALKFANANNYGKRTIRRIQAIRRKVKAARESLDRKAERYAARKRTLQAIKVMRVCQKVYDNPEPVEQSRMHPPSPFPVGCNIGWVAETGDRWLLNSAGCRADYQTEAEAHKETAEIFYGFAARILEDSPWCGPELRARIQRYRAAFAPRFESIRAARASRKREAAKREAEDRRKREAERLEKWRAGDSSIRLYGISDDDGGALLRARDIVRDESTGEITGGTLDTSQGADVPLVDAVRVYRAVVACRARGVAWRRNGESIRVGYFQLDSINPDGSFRAGCHRIHWPEIARMATELGIA